MKDGKTKRAAIYARVSMDGQTTENQLRELRWQNSSPNLLPRW